MAFLVDPFGSKFRSRVQGQLFGVTGLDGSYWYICEVDGSVKVLMEGETLVACSVTVGVEVGRDEGVGATEGSPS